MVGLWVFPFDTDPGIVNNYMKDIVTRLYSVYQLLKRNIPVQKPFCITVILMSLWWLSFCQREQQMRRLTGLLLICLKNIRILKL